MARAHTGQAAPAGLRRNAGDGAGARARGSKAGGRQLQDRCLRRGLHAGTLVHKGLSWETKHGSREHGKLVVGTMARCW